MPGSWTVGIAVFVLVFGAGLLLRKILVRRPAPEELERRRRLAIHREGKMGDGEILDVESGVISYSYSVAGVIYTASQDAATLRDSLPGDAMSMLGPVSIKFDPRNPANSIVLCEEWSGLRKVGGK